MFRPGRHLPSLFPLVAALLAVASATPAHAEMNGVKVGESRLHPSFDLESRFDSAAAVVGTQGGGTRLIGDLVLHFRPNLKLTSPKESAVYFALNGGLDYNLYTGVVDAGSRAQSHLAGTADATLAFNHGGQVEFDLGDNFMRSDKVASPALQVGAISLFNDARAVILIRPTGGALEIDPSYHLQTEFFSPLYKSYIRPPSCPAGTITCDPLAVSGLNYLNHTFGLAANWKFLPKTALVLDASYLIRSYLAGGSGVGIGLLKAEGGLAGLITSHIAAIVKLGWGQDMTTGSFGGLIAQGELAYLLSDTASVRGGYVRNVEPVGGVKAVAYSDDRAYLEARMLIMGRLTMRAGGTYDFLTYRGGDARVDQTIGGEAGADFEIKQWMTVGAGYAMSFKTSTAGAFLNLPSFTRHEVFGRVGMSY